MTLQEIEEGWYQFRIVFIDKNGETNVDIQNRIVNSIMSLKKTSFVIRE